MKVAYKILSLFLFLIALSFSANAQTKDLSGLYNEEDDEEKTAIDIDSIDYEAYTKKTSSFKALFNGKPGRAIMYGVLIPGGGQIYNKRYWKFPIALAAEGAAIYTYINIRDRYRTVDKIYADVINNVEGANFLGLTEPTKIFTYRQNYRKTAEQAAIGMVVVHLLVAVEAYIDNHLRTFDISEDLSFTPTLISTPGSLPTAGLGISYTF